MSSHDGIFSDQTRQAMDNAFANIPEEPAEPAPRAAMPLAPVDGASVENVFERAVRESFEPVLQKYLSDNSGAVIERIEAPDPRMDGRAISRLCWKAPSAPKLSVS